MTSIEKPMPLIPLISIDGVIADQLIGSNIAPLASGSLQLFAASTVAAPTSTGNEPIDDDTKANAYITLQVGSSAFSLHPSLTSFFTHADNPRWYFFSLPLPDASSTGAPSSPVKKTSSGVGSGSYVRLTLPGGVDVGGSDLERARDSFEEVLIGRGFLTGSNFVNAADELSRSVQQGIGAAATAIRDRTTDHVSSLDSPPSPSQTKFSPTTHSFIEGAANVTSKSSTVTGRAAEALANVSISVGETVAGLFGLKLTDDAPAGSEGTVQHEGTGPNSGADDSLHVNEMEAAFISTPGSDLSVISDRGPSAWENTKTAGSIIGSGIGSAASNLNSAVTESAHNVIQHDYGAEAANLASTTGNAVSDAGKTVGNIFVGTSAVVHGGAVAYGATKSVPDQNLEKEVPKLADGSADGTNLKLTSSSSLEEVNL